LVQHSPPSWPPPPNQDLANLPLSSLLTSSFAIPPFQNPLQSYFSLIILSLGFEFAIDKMIHQFTYANFLAPQEWNRPLAGCSNRPMCMGLAKQSAQGLLVWAGRNYLTSIPCAPAQCKMDMQQNLLPKPQILCLCKFAN
jgi:hypothetical protein